jgi:phage terminase large subunit-like protein
MKHGRLQGVMTTTPKPVKWLRKMLANPATVVTRGSTYDNRANLSDTFYEEVIRPYEGTRLGRQELNAELLDDVPGALWTRAMIDAQRCNLREVEPLIRIVVAVDPAVTAREGSDETGIVVAAIGRKYAYILEDASCRATPGDWAAIVIKLWRKWGADRIVAEVNNGGDLVERNLRMAEGGAAIPFRAVHATRGKALRAEPGAALYERGLVRHVSVQGGEAQTLEVLEDQMCTFVPGAPQSKDTGSPDRLDALVWALTDLVISPVIVSSPVQFSDWQSISPV